MLSSGSSNHNQNRYQAVVGASPLLLRLHAVSVGWTEMFVSLLYPACLTALCMLFPLLSLLSVLYLVTFLLLCLFSSRLMVSSSTLSLSFCPLSPVCGTDCPPVVLQAPPVILPVLSVPTPAAPEGGEPEAPPAGWLEQLQRAGGP